MPDTQFRCGCGAVYEFSENQLAWLGGKPFRCPQCGVTGNLPLASVWEPEPPPLPAASDAAASRVPMRTWAVPTGVFGIVMAIAIHLTVCDWDFGQSKYISYTPSLYPGVLSADRQLIGFRVGYSLSYTPHRYYGIIVDLGGKGVGYTFGIFVPLFLAFGSAMLIYVSYRERIRQCESR